MNHDDIGNAMRRLPRATAWPRFTPDVIRRVRQEPRPRPMWRLVAVTAMTVVLVVGTYAASLHRERQQRVKALRSERQHIASELRQVKALADEAQPVIVLDNGNTRVIVDVSSNQQTKPIYY